LEQLGKSGCTQGARLIIEKPLAGTSRRHRKIERILLGTSDEDRIFRIDPYL
jgi:glucose-6-phosphate 1-dehydrogenase